MATKTSHFMRPLVALVALVAAMAALLIAYSASPVQAEGSCTTTASTTTCTFGPTGSEDTFVVPDGVSSIRVVATGAPGSGNLEGAKAGRGAQVSGDLAVTSGQKLYVNVGGAPTSVAVTCYALVACVGGFNGGGSGGFFGGGGGGASDVRKISRAEDGSLASRLIVAGGGGGAGEEAYCFAVAGLLAGGNGGDAGLDGGDGASCGDAVGGTGGDAGGQSAGGVGGSPNGQNGSLGLGGNGVRNSSGAGGGGYYGGGSGGDHRTEYDSDSSQFFVAAAGGGGGGSNLDPDGGDAPTIVTGGPSVTITYTTPPADTTPPVLTVPGPITNEATSPAGAVVTFNATAEDAVDGSVEVSCTPPSGSTFPIATREVSCSATDAAGNTSTATFFVTVRDTTEPSVTCSVTPNKLSLPANNHKLVTVNATVDVKDNNSSGPDGFTLVSVKSSQKDSGLGPDDVAGDMPNWTTGTADTSGQLRAERYGKDRVYTLNYEGYDKAGNKATCSATVTVPKKGG